MGVRATIYSKHTSAGRSAGLQPLTDTDMHTTDRSGSACGLGTQQAVSKVVVSSVVEMCCFEINTEKEKAM